MGALIAVAGIFGVRVAVVIADARALASFYKVHQVLGFAAHAGKVAADGGCAAESGGERLNQ